MTTSRKKTLNKMEIDEILNGSESGLETEIDDLDLSSTDEENHISAPNVRKRHDPRI
jgi:hypothetical protein